jgi:hypothetical protein
MRKITILKTKEKHKSMYRYRLRRKKNKVKLTSISEIYSGDVMNPYFNMYGLAEAIWANCNIKEFPEKRKKVEQTKAISIIPAIMLVIIYKLKNSINNSVIKHLEEEFSKKTIDIINYISILFSINNYRILS